jgi:hypothetical protein
MKTVPVGDAGVPDSLTPAGRSIRHVVPGPATV